MKKHRYFQANQAAIEVLTLCVVVFPALAYGGYNELFRSLWDLLGLVLLALVLFYRWQRGPVRPVTRYKIEYAEPWPALLLLGIFGLVHVAQLVPLPSWIVRVLAGWNPDGAWAQLSPYPEATVRSLLSWIPAAAVFAAPSLIYDSRAQARRLMGGIFVLAALISVYGIAETISGHEMIWGLAKRSYRGCVTGTFISRNNFAALMTLALGCGVGVGFYQFSKLGQNAKQDGAMERLFLICFAAALCLLGLILSKSRGGLSSVVLAGLPTGIWLVGRRRRRIFITLILVLAAAAILMGWWISREPLTQRFTDLPEDVRTTDARPAAWLVSLRIFLRGPLFGTGAGTFEDQFRYTPDTHIYSPYNHAHSDPLETLAETGIVGFIGLAGAIGWVLIRSLRALAKRNSRFARALSIGGLAGIASVLVHSLYDFPLQNPGVRASFFAILGVTYLVANRRLTR